MDNLQNILMNRAVEGGLVAPPPADQPKLPPADQRWATAEKMKSAYRNGWSPNPMLIANMEKS